MSRIPQINKSYFKKNLKISDNSWLNTSLQLKYQYTID